MLLTVHELTKEFKRGGTVFAAVSNVSLSARPGEFICISGRSGSGKTTLLNLIMGLLNPTSGHVFYDDKDMANLTDTESSYLRNASIGYVAQGYSLLSNLNILDNIRVPYYLVKRAGNPGERARALLRLVGLSEHAEAYPANLSGGELRRVAIARALINSPSFIIADEPTGDLDGQTTNEIMMLLSDISKTGTAVILVSHETDMSAYGSRFFSMSKGKLLEQ